MEPVHKVRAAPNPKRKVRPPLRKVRGAPCKVKVEPVHKVRAARRKV